MPISLYQSAKPSYQSGSGSQPPRNSVAIFQWEQFQPITHFSSHALNDVFNKISRDIIERPYHYDPHELYDDKGKRLSYTHTMANNSEAPSKIPGGAVYKRNHGTGHALRQMVYAEKLIDLLTIQGNTSGKAISNKVNQNPHLKSAIKLAAFCKRIGRTLDHEVDHHQPTIYSKRSSDMFALMAKELGFEDNLVNIISHSMLEPRDPTAVNHCANVDGLSAYDLALFSENILMASHKADLVRLLTVRSDFIVSDLSRYCDTGVQGVTGCYTNQTASKAITKALIEFACKANEITGNRVVQQERDITHPTVQKVNAKALVNVRNDIPGSIAQLSSMSLMAQPLPAPSYAAAAAVASPSPYKLKNNHIVTGIINKGAYFKVVGLNNSGQQRAIQVYKNGSIKDYKGGNSIPDKTMNTDSQMKENIAEIFKHFGMTLPVAPSITAPSSAAAATLRPPYQLQNNHTVTDIINKGAYLEVVGLNNSGQQRAIQVYKNGSIKDYKGGNSIPDKTMNTDSQMKENIAEIFKHFGVTLPVAPSITAPSSAAAATLRPPYQLQNNHIVTGIINKGAYFKVVGLNNSGQQRAIQVYKNGSIKNYKGGNSIPDKTMNTDSQMKENIAEIFKHFGMTLPLAPSITAPRSAAAATLSPPYQLQNNHTVTDIINKDAYLEVVGLNNSGQQRSIQVHPDGSIKDYKGGDSIIDKSMNTDSQMKANIEKIFKHFSVTLPVAPSVIAPPSDAELKAIFMSKRTGLNKGSSPSFFQSGSLSGVQLNSMNIQEIVNHTQQDSTPNMANSNLKILIDMGILDTNKVLQSEFKSLFNSSSSHRPTP